MSDTGLSATEEAHVQQAADEAFRVLTTGDDELPARRNPYLETLRQATRQAPLHSLVVAFLLGALITRRR